MLLAACSSNEETFATKIKARGDAFNSVASSWDKGDAMVKEGNELVAKGKKEYDKGRSLMEDGQDDISKGQSMIEKGQNMKAAAESQYNQFRANPAYTGSK